MMLIFTNNIVMRMTAISIFIIYTCFNYNIALYYDAKNLSHFLINLIIAALASDAAV